MNNKCLVCKKPCKNTFCRSHASPYSIKRWIALGKSKEEAKYEVKSRKSTCIEYYIKKGLSLEEAQKALKERQRTFLYGFMIGRII